jgi:methylated-DNA-[protein]-cysteine S-methyltransferase
MEDVAGIYARESGYLDRYVQVGLAQGRVIAVSFPRTPADGAARDHDLLDRVEAYLQGEPDDFGDVSVALTMPTDRRALLERVREIPYGGQATVEELAGATPGLDPGDSEDRTLIRETLADNPAPLLVPDHRVRDGSGSAPADVEQNLRAVEGL